MSLPIPASRISLARPRDAIRRGNRVIDIHALECDEEVIAIFAGVADGHRFSMMFNTYTMSGSSKYSPGLILMRDIIDYYAGPTIAHSTSASAPMTTSGCPRTTSRSSTALFRSGARTARRERDVGFHPRQADGEAESALSKWRRSCVAPCADGTLAK